MSTYEKNLDRFRRTSEILYAKLTIEEPIEYFEIEFLEGNQNYLVRKDNKANFIHSLYDVENEMKMMFRHCSFDDNIVVLFGFGYGHAVKYLKEKFPDLDRVVVIEPSLQIFKETMSHVDIFELMDGLKVTFFINEEPNSLGRLITTFLSKSPKYNIAYNLSYRNIFSEYYETFTSELIRQLKSYVANLQLIRMTNDMWLYNAVSNFKHKSLPLEHVKNWFKDKPVIIVGAGPSLMKNIHLLKECRERAIVVAVGSAIRVLEKNNIIPDLRMAYDGSPLEMKILDGMVNSDVPLIYSNRLYHKILDDYEGSLIRMVIDADTLTKYVFEHGDFDYLSIRTAPSISVVALDMFCKMNVSSVALVGQDLCFYEDGLEYATGGSVNEEVLNLNQHGVIEIQDIYGNTAYTNTVFDMIKDNFKVVIEHFPNIEVFQATEGGAEIPGASIMSFRSYLNEKCQNVIHSNFKDYAFEELNKFDHSNFGKKVDAGFVCLYKDLLEIDRLNNARLKKIKKILKYVNANASLKKPSRVLNDLDSYEKLLQSVELYAKEIQPNLELINRSIRGNYEYHGIDKDKQTNSLIKIVLGYTAELNRYVNLYKEIVEMFEVVKE